MLSHDPLENVLYIDLSRKTSRVERRPELFDAYLGGAGAAIHLLEENCPAGIDPHDPANPVIFAVGPLTGVLPLASKTVAMFKSPLTGNLGESHAGGRSAVAIRTAGYGAIVITGASDIPIYLSIHEGRVRFRDARSIWGLSSMTAGRIIRENEPGAGMRTIMRIGTAGEALVPYANVTIETYRHFGRLGLGAVLGSKRVKGIVVAGHRALPVADARAYRRVYDQVYDAAVSSPVMKKYYELGTPANVLPLDEIGALPTRNLQAARFEGACELSGEALADNYLGRRLACAHCPVACIHIAAVREPYEQAAYFYKTTMIGYDYETIYALGTMLGIDSAKAFLRLIAEVDNLGMDAMSAGVALAWATEAMERGLVGPAETDGIALRWGDASAYRAAAKRLVSQPTPFYQALAQGVEHASSVYGGQEYALAFGRNEMPGYHTGPAGHIGFLIGARHSHLDNAGYALDQKAPSQGSLTPEKLVDALIEEEAWRQILSSTVVCFFARGIYTPELTQEALTLMQMERSPQELQALGEEIWAAKYRFKLREGFDPQKIRIPGRIYETPSALGAIEPAYVEAALASAWERVAAIET